MIRPVTLFNVSMGLHVQLKPVLSRKSCHFPYFFIKANNAVRESDFKLFSNVTNIPIPNKKNYTQTKTNVYFVRKPEFSGLCRTQ